MDLSPLNVALRRDGRVCELTFDHGKANEVGTDVLRALEDLVRWLEAEPAIQVLVSRSTKQSRRGTPIFVAGADVSERAGWTDQQVITHVAWQRGVLDRVRNLPLLHVACIDGVAFGWGTEWTLTADVVLAGPRARFALPETGLGIVPGAGGTGLLARRIGQAQALRLGLTGEVLDAAAAMRTGLAQEAFEEADAMQARVDQLIDGALRRSPTANALYKMAVLATGDDPARALELEANAYARCVTSGEAARGREQFAAARRGDPVRWPPRQAGLVSRSDEG